MNIGFALSALLQGKKIRRSAWLRNTVLSFEVGSAPGDVEIGCWGGVSYVGAIPASLFDAAANGTAVRNPSISKRLGDGSIETGAAFSAIDLLAGDWEIV